MKKHHNAVTLVLVLFSASLLTPLWNLSLLPKLVVAVLLLGLTHLFAGLPQRQLGIRAVQKQELMLFFDVLALAMPVAAIARILTPSFDSWYAPLLGLSTGASYLAFLLFPLVLAVLLEEVLVRGVAQPLLTARYGSFAAVAFATLFFASYHLDFSVGRAEPLFFAVLFLTVLLDGLLLALFYARTKALLLSVLLHLAINLLILLQIYLHLHHLRLEVLFWLLWGVLLIVRINAARAFVRTSTGMLSPGRYPVAHALLLSVLAILPLLVQFTTLFLSLL